MGGCQKFFVVWQSQAGASQRRKPAGNEQDVRVRAEQMFCGQKFCIFSQSKVGVSQRGTR